MTTELWFALDVALKATIVLAIGGLLTCPRCMTSAMRHRIWAATFLALIIVPAAQLLLPIKEIPALPTSWTAANAQQAELVRAIDNDLNSVERSPTSSGRSVPEVNQEASKSFTSRSKVPEWVANDSRSRLAQSKSTATDTANTPSTVPLTSVSINTSLVFIWSIGVVLFATPVLIGIAKSTYFFATRRALQCHPLNEKLEGLSRTIGLKHTPNLYLVDGGQMPMTMGGFRPWIVLPSSAVHWTDARISSVLLHELGHIRRHDVLLQLMMRFICAVYWFHPMVWWAIRKSRMDRELACDDLVLQAGCDPVAYARELLGIAREHKVRIYYASAAMYIARQSQLEGRLLAVLDDSRRRGSSSRATNIAITSFVCCIAVGLGIVRLGTIAHGQDQSGTSRPDTSLEKHVEATAIAASVLPTDQATLEGVVLDPTGTSIRNAKVEYIIHDQSNLALYMIPGEEKVEYFETTTDTEGKFQLKVPRYTNRLPRASMLVVSSPGQFPIVKFIDPRLPVQSVSAKFSPSETLRFRVETGEKPIIGLLPRILSWVVGAYHTDAPHPRSSDVLTGWPAVKEVGDGYYETVVPERFDSVQIFIDDPKYGVKTEFIRSEKIQPIRMSSPVFLNGTVRDQAGNPVENVLVMVPEKGNRSVRTDRDGKFRLAPGDTGFESVKYEPRPDGTLSKIPNVSYLHFFPPAESDLLNKFLRYEWPKGNEVEASFVLDKGISIEGQVVDQQTSEPIVGAELTYRFDNYTNEYAAKNMAAMDGLKMRYVTDHEGRFHVPVPPGIGQLHVARPSFEYLIAAPISPMNSPDLHNNPFAASAFIAELALQPDSKPEPMRIELRRGRKIQLHIRRPDGSPAEGIAVTAGYRYPTIPTSGVIPMGFSNGEMELLGVHANTEVVFIDREGDCGLKFIIEPYQKDQDEITIQLRPLVTLKATLTNSAGDPKIDYRPDLFYDLNGIVELPDGDPNRERFSERMTWALDYDFGPTTDKQGEYVHKLVLGVHYKMYLGDAKRVIEFTPRDGKVLNLGTIVVSGGESTTGQHIKSKVKSKLESAK